ncbi:MAG TPA: aminopeptidase P family N-terminal domain-containing protein, partial [Chryseolinea sp.]|nr:aminopeptidase P family N-terminal domain-containing protein [Chryseolinea sp.]
MEMKRRNFLQLSTLAVGTFAMNSCSPSQEQSPEASSEKLKPMTDNVIPITLEERKGRIEKAQRLLVESKIEALVLDAGTSLEYFTGISWWPSERPLVAIVPARGDVQYVCPGFEESRLHELITI